MKPQNGFSLPLISLLFLFDTKIQGSFIFELNKNFNVFHLLWNV